MLSYAAGPEAPLAEIGIYEYFLKTVASLPDHDAIVVPHQGIRWSYRELADQAESVARGLRALGITSGDRFGMWAANCAEWVVLQLAAARTGAALVNINPAYRAHELEYVLRRSGMKAIFLHEQDEYADYRAILHEASRENVTLQRAIYLGTNDWIALCSDGIDAGSEFPSRDEVANIQYTSGTTGSPKGVLLTHRNILNNGRFIAQRLRMTGRDRICAPVPMYHCFGCVIGTMAAISSGACLILPAPRFHADATLRAIQNERATMVYGVPTMFIAQLSHPDFARTDFSSLRGGVMAGAPCPVEVMKRVMTDMHCPEITIVYGQTEASPVITGSAVDDSVERRVATVGTVFPQTEVKIVSVETGETVPMGVQGELCARGYLIMKGYDGDPEGSAKVVDPDGWLHTGDLATMREDGYINITGRAKDVIIRGGENIYPREVEEFLHTHPKIAQVEVVGLPDQLLGEAVLAWIKLRTGHSMTESDVREFCHDRIAHFKVPQYIRFVDSFPMTLNGKTQKHAIRQREIEARGLQEISHVRTA